MTAGSALKDHFVFENQRYPHQISCQGSAEKMGVNWSLIPMNPFDVSAVQPLRCFVNVWRTKQFPGIGRRLLTQGSVAVDHLIVLS